MDKAADQLKALLVREPDNPTYNNDLGYIWADHDMNLAESEKLIRKAIDDDRRTRRKANPDLKPELDKDNAAYLDSLGWVLFKQKKYKEARDCWCRPSRRRRASTSRFTTTSATSTWPGREGRGHRGLEEGHRVRRHQQARTAAQGRGREEAEGGPVTELGVRG